MALRCIPVLVAALCAVVLGACGGGDPKNARTVLDQAFGPATPTIHSGRLDLRLDVDGRPFSGLPVPLSVHVTGPFAGGRKGALPAFDLRLAVQTASGRMALGGISTGDRAWVILQDRAYALAPADVKRLNGNRKGALAGASARPAGTSLRSLGVDPRAWLRDPVHQGTETLAGEKVEHVSAGVDVPRLLTDVDRLLARAGRLGSQAAQVPTALPEAARAQIERAVREADVDLWTGQRDHVLRRIAVTVRYDAAGRPGTLRFALGIAGVNRPQAIGPPPQSRPVGELAAALRRFSATLARRQASGVANGTSYEQCLADAGGDLARAQGCAGLVGR